MCSFKAHDPLSVPHFGYLGTWVPCPDGPKPVSSACLSVFPSTPFKEWTVSLGEWTCGLNVCVCVCVWSLKGETEPSTARGRAQARG